MKIIFVTFFLIVLDKAKSRRTCECGISSEHLNASMTERYPWMAKLVISIIENEERFFTEGVLIDHRSVLTSSLLEYYEDYTSLVEVYLGQSDRNILVGEPYIGIKVFHDLKCKKNEPLRRDISIVKLDRYVEYTPTVSPICIPSDPRKEFVTLKLITFGHDDNKTIAFPSRIKQFEEVYIKNFECEERRKEYAEGTSFENIDDPTYLPLIHSQICTISDKRRKSSCSGLSGSPLIYKRFNTTYLIGSTAGSWKCSDANLPTVYTSIQAYMMFIENYAPGACLKSFLA